MANVLKKPIKPFLRFCFEKKSCSRDQEDRNQQPTFINNINNLTKTSRRNLFPSEVIENVKIKFFNNNFTPDFSQSAARNKDNQSFLHHNTTHD